MRIGVLTGGGDCPGLNAVIRAIVRKGSFHYEDEFVGFMEGWRGLLENKTMQLDLSSVGGILPRGGTILRTSRTNPAKHSDGLDRCIANLKEHSCDALIAIGGDDTLSVAQKLFANGVKVVGVPKTIDNDLAGTDFTFGFDTAVNVATGAIDRVHTTAEAHNRVIVVEVMGRDSGWIAAYSGIGGGADVDPGPRGSVRDRGGCRADPAAPRARPLFQHRRRGRGRQVRGRRRNAGGRSGVTGCRPR